MVRCGGPRSGAVLVAVAVLALTSFAGELAEGWLVHTDDGCTVEIHCLTCRWVQTAVPTLGLALALWVVLRPAGRPTPATVCAGSWGRLEAHSSRGPPLS